MKTQPILKGVHQQRGTEFDFQCYRLQFVKIYQFIKLN